MLTSVESAAVVENNDKQQLQPKNTESAENAAVECDDGRVVNCRTLPLFNYTDLTPPPVGADADILQDENCPSVIISPPPPPLISNNKSLINDTDNNNNNALNYRNDNDDDDNDNDNIKILGDDYDHGCSPRAATETTQKVATTKTTVTEVFDFYKYRYFIMSLIFCTILFTLTTRFYLYFILLLTLLVSFIIVIVIIVVLYYLLFMLLISFIVVTAILVIIIVHYRPYVSFVLLL